MRHRSVAGACMVFMMSSFAASVDAQTVRQKVPVVIKATIASDDMVGRQVVFELKEALRSSASFQLIDDPKYDILHAFLKMSLVTLRQSAGSTAIATATVYDSIEMPLNGAYISASVHTCGSERAVGCARQMLSSMDEDVEVL